jgi:hypothetical protein
VDTYSRVADVKLYTEKTAITAADMLNDRVAPFFDEQEVPLMRILLTPTYSMSVAALVGVDYFPGKGVNSRKHSAGGFRKFLDQMGWPSLRAFPD